MPSPKTLPLLLLLVVASTVSATADTITITGGTISVSQSTVTSALSAPGFLLTEISGDGFFFNAPGWPTDCSDVCTLSTIQSIATSGMVQFNTPGFLKINGDDAGFSGFPKFTAVSFNSSLGTDGILTVTGLALGSSTFDICQPPGVGADDCKETGLVFAFSSKPFHFVAHFGPRPTDPGFSLYQFQDVTITSVPEPSTMAFIGIGMAAIELARRRMRRC